MARTYKTLSLTLPPDAVEKLSVLGKATGRVAARVATEIVLREIAKTPGQLLGKTRSWCCGERVVPVQISLVLPESPAGERRWVPIIALLCKRCRKQQHGYEYQGWVADA